MVVLPWKLQLTKSKKRPPFYINLNQYRNAHFHILANAKIAFSKLIHNDVLALPLMSSIEITYKVFPGSKRLIDISNVCSVADKFFCDTLTTLNRLPDDNYKHLANVMYQFGEVDSTNPRIEAHITVLEYQKENPMRIIMNNDDLKKLLIDHVTALVAEGTEFSVEFSGEGDDLEANILIGESEETTPKAKQPAPAKRTRRTKAEMEADAAKEAADKAATEEDEKAPFDTEDDEEQDEEPEQEEPVEEPVKPKNAIFARLKTKDK